MELKTLSEAEVNFLYKLLTPYVEYYGLLSRANHCSVFNRKRWDQIRQLAAKLEQELSNDAN
jgi:hypothetical protein